MKAARENLSFELENLAKAKDALQYSYEKCQKIKLHEGLSYEELESFEALTSRFARLSDIIIQKILRLLDFIDLEDTGTVRDRINRAEKKGGYPDIVVRAFEVAEAFWKNEPVHWEAGTDSVRLFVTGRGIEGEQVLVPVDNAVSLSKWSVKRVGRERDMCRPGPDILLKKGEEVIRLF